MEREILQLNYLNGNIVSYESGIDGIIDYAYILKNDYLVLQTKEKLVRAEDDIWIITTNHVIPLNTLINYQIKVKTTKRNDYKQED